MSDDTKRWEHRNASGTMDACGLYHKDGRVTWNAGPGLAVPQVSPGRVAPKAQSWTTRLLVAGLSTCFVLTLVALTAGVTGLAVKWAWSVLVR